MAIMNILFPCIPFCRPSRLLSTGLPGAGTTAGGMTLLNAILEQREQRAAIMMEWSCSQVGNGPAVGAAPSLHQMEGTRSSAIMWATVGLSLPLYFFFALVSLAHLLTPCWTSVVISRHFTAKRRQVNESSRTQRKKLKGNPDVMVVGGWVKLAYYDMLWCVYEDGLFPTL